jgi:tRNA(Ile)-lysidine synthase
MLYSHGIPSPKMIEYTSMDIFLEFKKSVEQNRLVQPGDKILVAYSGGPDSTALVDLLLELSREWPLEISLAHFNHKLRRTAARDERFVRTMAGRWKLRLFGKSQDVKAHARRKRLNLEEAGRELRYNFLKMTAAKIGANKIATGHTMNDQAETVLMRLLRGTGRHGLGGISPIVDGTIIRPLLGIERQSLAVYLRRRGLRYCRDETNEDRRFLRNKVRLGLIPYLQKNYDAGIVRRLTRLASLLQEEDEFLDRITREKCRRLIMGQGTAQRLDGRHLSSFPVALARRCVRQFLRELKGDLRGISYDDVDAVLGLTEGKDLHLKKGLFLHREGDFIFLRETSGPRRPYQYLWDGRDTLPIGEIGVEFQGRRIRKPNIREYLFDNATRCYCDAGKLHFPLIIRSRRDGDRYRPLGSPGRKKLKEIFRAKGVSVRDRDRLPVFLSGEKIVWVPELPVADEFKLTSETKTVFVLTRL